jgi:hypothetical protein
MPIKRRPPQALVLKEKSHAASELAGPRLHPGRGADCVALRRLEMGASPVVRDRDERPLDAGVHPFE